MRIKQLNSYILATVKVSPTFSASSVLFQVCEQYIQSFLFSTSWLASFVYCASGDLCLAFWHWHPAVAFRAGIEGESPSPAPSYCTGHLLFSRLFWQNHLPCSDHKLFGVPILFYWMVFRDIRSNAFYSPGFSRLSKWKAFISCLLLFLSSKVFWLIFL